VGIAVSDGALTFRETGGSVPVRLSSFSRRNVSVRYTVSSGGTVLQSGSLTFEPGRTVKKVEVDLGERAGAVLSLSDPENGEITGRFRLYLARRVTLIPLGSVWKYSDAGVDLGSAWRGTDFDDSAWKEGPGELGFGDGDEATVVEGGPSGARHPTTYFRRRFQVADPGAFDSLRVGLRRDDGAVVYLNGTELFRSNMPAGEISYDTWSAGTASGGEEDALFSFEVAPSALRDGTNVLAVEVHQAAATSSDLSFELTLIADPVPSGEGRFVRGDASGDGKVDISDAVGVLLVLFAGAAGDCADALDANDSGTVDIADAVYILSYLFSGGRAIPPPFPRAGEDPTVDDLDCGR